MLMLFGFISYSLMYTQIVPYLIEMGYDATKRSHILAMFALIAMVGQILVGYLSDKYGTIKRFFIYITLVYMVTGVLAYILNTQHYLFHFIVVSSMAAFTRIQCNILEIWPLQVKGLYKDFGAIRAFGSIGWALAAFVSGLLVTHLGFASLGWTNLILNIGLIVYTFKWEDIQRVDHVPLKLDSMLELLRNKNFMLLLGIFLLIFTVYNVDFILVTELIYNFGGKASDIGVRGFIHAIVEVPMMFMVGRFLIRYKNKKVLIFGIIMLFAKFILFAFSTTVPQIYLYTTLQMVSFPLILIAQRDMINHEVPDHLKSTGQMMMSAITSGFSAIISPLASASLTNHFGVSHALLILAITLIVPILLTIQYQPRKTL